MGVKTLQFQREKFVCSPIILYFSTLNTNSPSVNTYSASANMYSTALNKELLCIKAIFLLHQRKFL